MVALDAALLALAALVLVTYLVADRSRLIASLVTVTAASAVVVVVVVGWRWQNLPPLVLSLAGVVLLWWRAVRGPRPAGQAARVLRGGVIGVLGLGLVSSWAVLMLMPTLRLPVPEGPQQVGGRTMAWSHPGAQGSSASASSLRSLDARVWFPTRVAGTRRMAYLGEDATVIAQAAARVRGLPPFALEDLTRVSTQTWADAPVRPPSGGWPVVIFSPDAAGLPSENTAWAQHLASWGFVVVALDHHRDPSAVIDKGDAVDAMRGPVDQQPVGELPDLTVETRAVDLSEALNHLTQLNAAPGEFHGAFALDRVAVAGHGGVGGAAALLAGSQDARFRAVLDIDGTPVPIPGGRQQPVLVIASSAAMGRAPVPLAHEQVLAESGRASARLVVADTAPLSFTDAALYLPPVPAWIGTAGRRQGLTALNTASLAFLRATLADGACDPPRLWAQSLKEVGELSLRC